MVNEDSCPFCAIINDQDTSAQVVLRTDRIIAFAPLHPATRGHLLVVPVRHSADIGDMKSADLHAVVDGVQRVRQAIALSLQPSAVNIIQSNGALATQTVAHVHFHVVPRWEGDHMKLDWPSAEDSTAPMAEDIEAVRKSIPTQESQVAPEDRRQHLSFIQAVITRMAHASASAKTWLLPILTATFGFAIAKEQPVVALLGVIGTIVFGLLDANYLKQERAFRVLYDKVAAGGQIPDFAMNPSLAGSEGRQNYWPDAKDLWSWSIAPFYLPLAFAGVGLGLWLWLAS